MVLCSMLSSEQEEADTKVFLCAQFAFDIGFERAKLVTADTDVAILGMYFQFMLNVKIYLHYGASSAMTLYDLSENLLDRSFAQALPGLHAFSGSNTTSCFEGKGTLKKHNIFSGVGLPIISSFAQQKLYLLTKFMFKAK